MNVIVSNKQKEIIDNANIDAIKDLNGLFNVDDLVNKFRNYFFSKMILDATSVVDFATREVLQKLVDEIGSDRLIILLPSKPEPPEEFKKLLIDLKIYNFSNNIDEVVGFIEKPNTYENLTNSAVNSSNNNEYYVDNSIKDGNNINSGYNDQNNLNNIEKPIINNNFGADNRNNDNVNNHTSFGDIMNKFNVNQGGSNQNNNSNIYQNDNMKLESFAIPNNGPINNVSGGRNVFLNMDDYNDNINYNTQVKKSIIGFRNVTEHAGSTTLIYMLQKAAQKRNIDAIGVEINRNDFKLFRDNKMISINENEIDSVFNSLRESLVFVDLNDCLDDAFCTDMVYLVEPSVIKLNRLMATDKSVFSKLANKKIILNQSMLSNTDIPVLEGEAGIRFFDNIPPINDRSDSVVIEELFKKLID